MAVLTQAEIDELIKKFQTQRDSRPGPVLLHFPSPETAGKEIKGDVVLAFIANSAAARDQKPNPLK